MIVILLVKLNLFFFLCLLVYLLIKVLVGYSQFTNKSVLHNSLIEFLFNAISIAADRSSFILVIVSLLFQEVENLFTFVYLLLF